MDWKRGVDQPRHDQTDPFGMGRGSVIPDRKGHRELQHGEPAKRVIKDFTPFLPVRAGAARANESTAGR